MAIHEPHTWNHIKLLSVFHSETPERPHEACQCTGPQDDDSDGEDAVVDEEDDSEGEDEDDDSDDDSTETSDDDGEGSAGEESGAEGGGGEGPALFGAGIFVDAPADGDSAGESAGGQTVWVVLSAN